MVKSLGWGINPPLMKRVGDYQPISRSHGDNYNFQYISRIHTDYIKSHIYSLIFRTYNYWTGG